MKGVVVMKFKKGLAALVALMLLSSTSVAFAMNAVVSEIKSYYVGTQEYLNAAKAEVFGSGDSLRVSAITRISVGKPYHFAEKGMLGASSELFDQNGNSVATAPMAINSGSSNFCDSYEATVYPKQINNYYAKGYSYVWDGKRYVGEPTYKSPLISSGTSYSVNQFGQTYGSALYADTFDERPDLMAAIGDDGVAGYIYTDDLKSENPKTPAEAVARQEMYEALIANWDGQEAIVVRTIPLYESDGRTVIGDYNISFTPSDGNWNW